MESISASQYQANNGAVVAVVDGLDGKALRLTTTDQLSGSYPGIFIKELNLPANAKIEITFDYISTVERWYGFYVTNWSYESYNTDVNGQGTAFYANANVRGTHTTTVQLGDRKDFMLCINDYGNAAMDVMIDNLKIKIVG
jgi:hypothetical protein